MKKTRKLLALLMVLAIMLSMLVLPVSAAIVDNEIEPLAEYIPCPRCGGDANVYERIYDTQFIPIYSSSACVYGVEENHTHERRFCYEYVICNDCGTYTGDYYTYDKCLG